jgi:hypothetical protein
MTAAQIEQKYNVSVTTTAFGQWTANRPARERGFGHAPQWEGVAFSSLRGLAAVLKASR